MYFSKAASAAVAATLAIGTQAAAAVQPRQTASPGPDPMYGEFRIFGVAGCQNENEGYWKISESDANLCKPMDISGPNPGVLSVELQEVTVAGRYCGLFVYTDTACTEQAHAVNLNSCVNGLLADGQPGTTNPSAVAVGYKSWKYDCHH